MAEGPPMSPNDPQAQLAASSGLQGQPHLAKQDLSKLVRNVYVNGRGLSIMFLLRHSCNHCYRAAAGRERRREIVLQRARRA